MNKRFLSLLVFLVFFLTACQPNVKNDIKDTQPHQSSEDTSTDEPEWEFSWDTLEARTFALRNRTLQRQDPQDLYQLKYQLLSPPNKNGVVPESVRTYWYAYVSFNLILVEESFGESDQVKRLLIETIQTLDSIENKSVEVRALLAILYRLRVKHEPDNTFELVLSMQNHLDAAIELDPENLRTKVAQTMLAVRPIPGFGIDEDVEATIHQALEVSPTNASLTHSPTWGRSMVFQLWLEWLALRDENSEFMKVLNRATLEFPEDVYLQQATDELLDLLE
ncbi:MAG: hypothetical protein F4039_09175 [Gammaproteobacteria bacterium]|nr:hypothetical protein [Gammaproteobacteria bacterium]MYF53831.1 hypothetical protein [Gammaproteobacteria bacterium]MYK44242.1 hypothetical protein [Gammaproteobacteria bacterium]